MTKEITKAYILQQIEDKFKLRELVPEKFIFSEEVHPIYDVAPHLSHWESRSEIASITSVGSELFFTVPANEKWELRAYQVIYGATGAHKGSGLYIDSRPAVGDYIYLDLKKGQEVSYVVNLPTPVTLQPGNRLQYYIDSYTSNQNLEIDIDIKTEELR